jgi:hypothetical protein
LAGNDLPESRPLIYQLTPGVMPRIDRLTHRKAAHAGVSARFRQLIVLVLTVIFGVLVSVSVNAQKTSEKKKAKTYRIIKNKAWVNHYANACEILEKKRTGRLQNTKVAFRKRKHSNEVIKSRTENQPLLSGCPFDANPVQHSIIREMVVQSLKEKTDNNPIELAPLNFDLHENRLSVKDINPFLIAVEFALQGKTILIENHVFKGDEQNTNNMSQLITEITFLMKQMGVPHDRISVQDLDMVATATSAPENLAVNFTAL